MFTPATEGRITVPHGSADAYLLALRLILHPIASDEAASQYRIAPNLLTRAQAEGENVSAMQSIMH